MSSILGLLNIGVPEIIILAALGLLIFGRRLPEVGRSLGRSIVEFKKGLAGVDDDTAAADATSATARPMIGTAPTSTAAPDAEARALREELKAAKEKLAASEQQQAHPH